MQHNENHLNVNAITNRYNTLFCITDNKVNALFKSEFSFEKVKEIADWILDRVDIRPKIGIVCGSGLGGLGDRLVDTKIFPYADVPNFPKSTGIQL